MRAVERWRRTHSWPPSWLAASTLCVVGALLGRGATTHLGVVFVGLVLTGPAALLCGGAWALDCIGRRWASAPRSAAGAPLVAGLLVLWLGAVASLPLGIAVRAGLETRTRAWASLREPRVEHFERVQGRRVSQAEYWELLRPLPWYVRAADVRYNEFLGRLECAD